MPRHRRDFGIIRYSAVVAIATYFAASGVASAQTGTPTLVWQNGWAGYVLYTPGYQPGVLPTNRFKTIEAEWVVPSAKPTINCKFKPEQTDGSSFWIGIDGWGENTTTPPYSDVLQAGTETDVPCWDGTAEPANAYFWIEWDGTKNIETLPLAIGDLIHLRIEATTTGPQAWREATVYLDDLTTGKSHQKTFLSGCLNCGGPGQERATLYGNTAEWVVETTFYSSGHPYWPNTLDDFGTGQLMQISVTDDHGVTYTPGAPGGASQEIDWMTFKGHSLASGDTLLACAAITGDQEITLTRAPYQIVTPGHQGDLEPKPQNCNGTSSPGP